MDFIKQIQCRPVGGQTSWVDLSHSLDKSTIFWPGGEGFNLCLNCTSSGGYHYAAGTFTCAEHCGTHVDAPFHFSSNGITVDLIPPESLIAQCRVINVVEKCQTTPDGNYQLSVDDILYHEHLHGVIEYGTIVLVKTGWASKYNQGPFDYLGYDESIHGKYDFYETILRFPGISNEAASLFVDRAVAAVGLDTASLDYGPSKDFTTHRILLGAGIYGIENINENINLLPETGSMIFVMPMKITGGSGAPSRVFVLLP